MTVEAPSASALMMWPLFWTPPSAMTGTPKLAPRRATWYTAAACPRPTAHTCTSQRMGSNSQPCLPASEQATFHAFRYKCKMAAPHELPGVQHSPNCLLYNLDTCGHLLRPQ